MDPIRKIVIIGLAKSGTSALYSSVKKALPAPRRLVFEPQNPGELGYVTDQDEENALTKMMFTSLKGCGFDPRKVTHGVCLTRDPRDTLVSYLLYQANKMPIIRNKKVFKRFRGLLKSKEKRPGSVPLVDVFDAIADDEKDRYERAMTRTLARYTSFMDRHPDFFVLKYEGMIRGELAELSGYLELDVSRPERLGGWIEKIGRQGTSGDWRNWLTDDDVRFFRPFMDPYLERFGYDTEWGMRGPQQISPRYCTEYIDRLVELRMADPNRRGVHESSDEALLSAMEDGKPVAMLKLARKVIDEGSTLASVEEAFDILFRMGQMGYGDQAVEAGEHYLASSRRRLAMTSFRNGMVAKHGPAFWALGSRLVERRDEKKVRRGLRALEKGAELGDERCAALLAKLRS